MDDGRRIGNLPSDDRQGFEVEESSLNGKPNARRLRVTAAIVQT